MEQTWECEMETKILCSSIANPMWRPEELPASCSGFVEVPFTRVVPQGILDHNVGRS